MTQMYFNARLRWRLTLVGEEVSQMLVRSNSLLTGRSLSMALALKAATTASRSRSDRAVGISVPAPETKGTTRPVVSPVQLEEGRALRVDDVLAEAALLQHVLAFCHAQWSAENLEFVQAARVYAAKWPELSEPKRTALAGAIYRRFLAEGAPEWVCTRANTAMRLAAALEAAPHDLLYESEADARRTLETDVLPRYLHAVASGRLCAGADVVTALAECLLAAAVATADQFGPVQEKALERENHHKEEERQVLHSPRESRLTTRRETRADAHPEARPATRPATPAAPLAARPAARPAAWPEARRETHPQALESWSLKCKPSESALASQPRLVRRKTDSTRNMADPVTGRLRRQHMSSRCASGGGDIAAIRCRSSA
jgi:hypothetical protein